jgi:hypothetical protein
VGRLRFTRDVRTSGWAAAWRSLDGGASAPSRRRWVGER